MSTKVTDKELVARVQAGDKSAFDALVLKYQHRIASLVSRFVRDPDDVMEVTQEAFIKAYRALPKFRGESAFYTWIYRIAVNTAKNFLVSRGRRPPGDDIDVQDAEHFESATDLRDIATPERILNLEHLKQVISDTVNGLPEELRIAITLREWDGLSYEEIAEVMECPIGTVRSRIFRAREAVEKNIRPLLDET